VIPDEMMRTKFTLMHFDSEEDLLHGIEALQHYSIPICEVYTPRYVPGIETKLRIKHIRLGNAILKYGCLGGTAITTLVYYLFMHDGIMKSGGQSAFTLLFTAFIMAITYFMATWLFPGQAPKVTGPRPGDNRYLIVANAKGVILHEDIIKLFQYTGAVEISSVIKNIVTA
jgi:hypothetical protein